MYMYNVYIYTLQQYCYYISTLTLLVELGLACFCKIKDTTSVCPFSDAEISGVSLNYIRVDENVYY